MKVLFQKHERVLLKNQREFCLELSQEELKEKNSDSNDSGASQKSKSFDEIEILNPIWKEKHDKQREKKLIDK
jgi:hypothetical protein